MKIEKLTYDNYKKVHKLFDINYPNIAFVYGIIEGKIPGEIWVDNKEIPKVCLIICNGNTPYCFIGGQLSPVVFTDFFSLLQAKDFVKLVCEPSSHDNQIDFGQYGFKSIPRVQYRYKNIKPEAIKEYENKSDFRLQQINDKQILDECTWNSLLINVYGDADHYLKFGLGFVLQDPINGQVVSEAHGVIGDNLIEVGTITQENYRRRNLSTIVCNQLIRSAIKEGRHPMWTCDASNEASNKIAQHQGMDDSKNYTFYTLKKNEM